MGLGGDDRREEYGDAIWLSASAATTYWLQKAEGWEVEI